jgi:uncharacterized membrane protein
MPWRDRERWRAPHAALWLKPALAIVIAMGLGVVLSRVRVSPGSALDPVAFKGSRGDARQLLAVVTGAMITVTSLVLVLTVATLQIAATQYSPRLLRSFLADRGTQVVMSTLVATDAYTLAGLQGVGSSGGGTVPRLAVSGALGLALLSVGMLVYYVGHMTNAIRIDAIMGRVEDEARQVLQRDHPVVEASVEDPDAGERFAPSASAATIAAARAGYVQGVANGRAVAFAQGAAVTIRLIPLIGYHVVEGEPLAMVWTGDGTPPPQHILDAVPGVIAVAPERVVERDVGLGFRQLVDITNRAMGTTQNDPYTAVQALHHLTTLLADAARRSFSVRELHDADGALRVIVPIMTFPTHLKVVCGHVRQGGLERHPRVTLELLRLLRAVATSAIGSRRRTAVVRELELVLASARRTLAAGPDLEEIESAGAEIRGLLESADEVSEPLLTDP